MTVGSIVTIPLALAVVACAGGNTPTAPGGLDMWITDAHIRAAGAIVNGMTLAPHQRLGARTFFEATLMGPEGPLTGQPVQVRYQLPHGPGMMFGEGFATLYDDGTNGDPIAGDGIYCLEELEGRFGFHRPGAPFGEYRYEFFGIHHNGDHTPHVPVIIRIATE